MKAKKVGTEMSLPFYLLSIDKNRASFFNDLRTLASSNARMIRLYNIQRQSLYKTN